MEIVKNNPYVSLELEIITYGGDDIITTSGGGGGYEPDDNVDNNW